MQTFTCPECGHESIYDPWIESAHCDQCGYTPDPAFTLQMPELVLTFFQDYQWALGEDPHLGAGTHVRYVRNYHPQWREAVAFVGAYLLLKRGERDTAAQHLRALTTRFPEFADGWVWLTATTDDPAERIEYLENGVLQEPAHPLARDALAIARGKVSPTLGIRRDRRGTRVDLE